MLQEKCAYCGDMTDMPFECNYCKDPFCSEHRLPEDHRCVKLTQIRTKKFDLVILDISMPGKNGLQTLKEIKQYNKKLPVLMLPH